MIRWSQRCVPRRGGPWYFKRYGSIHITAGIGRAATMSVTKADFRKALGTFATGVTVITLDSEGEVHGMTANAFTSVSLDPMLVLVCVNRQARTHAHLHAKKRFGVNVLAESQCGISEHYARPNREDSARAAGARFDRTDHGTPVLRGAIAYLECRLQSVQDAGDHSIFIAEVEDVVVRKGRPLLYFGSSYHCLANGIKPIRKPKRNARLTPTRR